MSVRSYEMHRRIGTTHGTTARYHLCVRHIENRKAVGYEVVSEREPYREDNGCDDCAEASEPTVMDRVIQEADAAARDDEPKPVPVLPGQRRLF